MKALVRRALDACVNRHRFNDSFVYRVYLSLAYPEVARAQTAEEDFYRRLLGTDPTRMIFDIGANQGGKAAIFAKLANKVVCVEADPLAVEVLRQRFANSDRVEIVGQACGARREIRKLHRFSDGSAYNTLSEKWVDELAERPDDSSSRPRMIEQSTTDVEVLSLDDLIGQYGTPAYIKIDVEGYELEVVQGLSLVECIISVECNLPVFEKETLSVIELLARRAPQGEFNYTTTEPPVDFAAQAWMPKQEIAELVTSAGLEFMEIYFKPVPAVSISQNE